MNYRTLVFLHGYGVRGDFWDPFKPFFEETFPQIFSPDLNMESPEILFESTKDYFVKLKEKYPETEIYLVCHSLGGVVAGNIVQEISDIISKIVFISPPYGQNNIKFKTFVRFLIKNQLIPDFLSRPNFFTKKTPKNVQKLMFKRVVAENESMIDFILFNDLTLELQKIAVESLVVGSEADKVVSHVNTKKFADKIGAKLKIYSKDEDIGHNDFVAAPVVASKLSQEITGFFKIHGKN